MKATSSSRCHGRESGPVIGISPSCSLPENVSSFLKELILLNFGQKVSGCGKTACIKGAIKKGKLDEHWMEKLRDYQKYQDKGKTKNLKITPVSSLS